ncbi:MAG: hypothetical protein H7X95_11270 [Deltaproteobacteria bacterium]|nr:hypothetical protein [Deltaproteobacteria bacterium]
MFKCLLGLLLVSSAVVGCGMEPMDEEAAAGDSDTVGETESNATAIRYISYGALNGNRAPCPSNKPVYDLRTKKCIPAPPDIYRRGCTQQTRCARG